jgi:subtilase family serine protease
MSMRFRHVMAALLPAGTASALAILPAAGITAGAVMPHSAAHRMTPAVSNPLAYKYAGKVGGNSTPTFGCQLPGAAINCYNPLELAKAYDIPASLTGAGQTIVIIDAFGNPTLSQDLNVEDTVFGLPAANLNVIYPDGQPAFDTSNADEVNWSGEIALDVESAHAVAPAATIDLVVSKSDQDADILSALKYVVGHRLGSVLSQSYGEAEACQDASITKADELLFAAAAAEGMSVFASSGDDGAAQPSCDGNTFIKAVSYPASDPLVTGVGATSLTASQPDGTYQSETAWNDEFGSSGGGYSSLFSRPLYQLGSVHNAKRGVPDVSYSGDVNNGLLIAWSQGDPANVGDIFIFGGTSAGSPQWAAIAALADQAAHHRLGFLNPALYLLSHGPKASYFFHDVTTGDNSVTLSDSNGNPVSITGYPAGKGWDAVTGIGTPDVAHLLQLLH